MRTNFSQNCKELGRCEHRWCATTNIDGLNGTVCDCMLLSRQSNLMKERSNKALRTASAVDFKVEGAEVTALATEGDVKVYTEGSWRHHDRLNP
jgi:hypothetical protein